MRAGIDFYYFTGTGNTLLVVDAMAAAFAARGVAVRKLRIERSDPKAVDLGKTLGLAFPVAAFSTYPLVWSFVDALPRADGTEVFMVATLGALSAAMAGQLRVALLRKGYKPLGAKQIVMPGNFMMKKIDPAKDAKTVAKAERKAAAFAVALLDGKTRWDANVPHLASALRWFFSKAFDKAGKVRFATVGVEPAKCSKCGLCAKLCPTGNIAMEGLPRFDGRCQGCMRCFAYCPTQAVYLGAPDKPYLRYQGLPPERFLTELEADVKPI